MRNYWALLPAIAVIVVLILLYAVPTVINPQWTSSILALFRQHPVDPEASPEEARREAGVLGPQQVKSRRMLAVAMVIGALALIGFNVSLNREANGCYIAATAFGAVSPSKDSKDPCVTMIFGSFFGSGSAKVIEDDEEPVSAYQLVDKHEPKYLKWIQNSPGHDDVDFLVGSTIGCDFDLRVVESADAVKVFIESNAVCPPDTSISLTAVKLKKPLGDRKILTADDKPLKQIDPDADSWLKVIGKLVTGG
ncbi:hypothetical protein [Kribbella sp. NPDC055071]